MAFFRRVGKRFQASFLSLGLAHVALTVGCDTGGGGGGQVTGLSVAQEMSVVSAGDGGATRGTGKGVSDFPPDAAYFTDSVHSFVFDESMKSLQTVNEILCLFAQTGYAEMVNRGFYRAQIDEGLCREGSDQSSDSSSEGQSSGSQGEQPSLWVIKSSRASRSAPEIVQLWVPNQEDGDRPPATIHVHVDVTKGVSNANPFGSFALNFAGVPDGGTEDLPFFFGTLQTVDDQPGSAGFTFLQSEGDITAVQDVGQSASLRRSAVSMSADGSSGEAVVDSKSRENFGLGDSGIQEETFRLAYDQSNVLRQKDSDAPVCLSRVQFTTRVWRYNLYHATDDPDGKWRAGDTVTRNGGFGIQFVDGQGEKHYGWAGYWGVWMAPGVNLQNGDTVTRHEFGSASSRAYSVVIAPGRLIKSTKQTLSLSSIVTETFTWTDFQGGGEPVRFRLQLAFSSGIYSFEKTGQWDFAQNDWTDLPQPYSSLSIQDGEWVGMWSDALGGPVNYVGGNSFVTFYKTEFVNGESSLFDGSDAVTLVGYQQCLKTGITGVEAESGDIFLQDSVDVDSPHLFTFSRDDLTLRDSSSGDPAGLAQGEAPTSGPNLWGMRSGPMVPQGTLLSNVFDIFGQDVFYNYETGHNQWNHYTALRDGSGTYVSFDPPLQFSYTHSTANDADGDSSHDGKKVFLQYNGPGGLWGIPMEGVSFDGQGGGKDRFYPIFSIADGVLLGPGGNDFVIKAIEKEQQLRPVNFVECAGLLLPAPNALPLPDVADYEPPGIGDPPVITAPPAVIQGVVQK